MAENAGLGQQINIDSAGTIAIHVGERPDRRSQHAGIKRGLGLSNLQARQIKRRDFDTFDVLIALDRSHLETMRERALKKCKA